MRITAARVLDDARARHAACRVRRARVTLADGEDTAIYVASHPLRTTGVRVALLAGQQRLTAYCARRGIADALVGGFFTRDPALPLGEVRTGGIARRHVPFTRPFGAERACVHVHGGRVQIAPRDELAAEPAGDLLQAGPLLVTGGTPVYDRARDPEGFSAGAAQFDSDITDGRHPRAAIGAQPRRGWLDDPDRRRAAAQPSARGL